MARTPKITRTIKVTEVTAFVADIEARTTEERTITLPRTYKNDEKILKALDMINTDEKIKVISIISKAEKTLKLYMTMADFVKYSAIEE